MMLHKLHLDLRCREVRRDLGDPYEMHSTLCRAFSGPEAKCAPGTFLWRLEPETNDRGMPKIIVQSKTMPDWSNILTRNWFAEDPYPPIAIVKKLRLDTPDSLIDERFRFRLRANPSVCRKGKRFGLYKPEEQESWLLRQGQLKGFTPQRIHRSQELMLTGHRRSGQTLRVFSVLFEGVLQVTEPTAFVGAVSNGIGHGKTMGLGLLSVAPVR